MINTAHITHNPDSTSIQATKPEHIQQKKTSDYSGISQYSIANWAKKHETLFLASIPVERAIAFSCHNFFLNPDSKFVLPTFCAQEVFGIGLQETIRNTLYNFGNPIVTNLKKISDYFLPTDHLVKGAFRQVNVNEAIVSVGLEELVCRELIQNQLLKNLPKKIIASLSPEHQHLVDSKIAKISRVMLSSIIFALMHTKNWDCAPGGGIFYQFAGGIFLGSIKEITGSTMLTTAVHVEMNWHLVLESMILGAAKVI